MKNYKAAPCWMWYAPVITGFCYITVFVLWSMLGGDSQYRWLGDMFWNIGLVCIVLSMVLFHRLNLNGRSWWRKFSLWIPIAGSLSYQMGALTGYFGEPVVIFFPAGAFLTATGMVIVGIQVVKTKELKEWKRFMPLLVGLYPFLVMFPILFITGSPDINAIMLWGIPWKITGCVLLNEFYTLKRAAA